MKYMILMNATKTGFEAFGAMPRSDLKAHMNFMQKLNEDLKASGELVSAMGLGGPDTVKIVRAKEGGGAPIVSDGPFAESKEVLAGYWILEVRDEARIIEIATHISTAPGKDGVPLNFPVEVRIVPEQDISKL